MKVPGAPAFNRWKNKGFHLPKTWFLGSKNMVFDGFGRSSDRAPIVWPLTPTRLSSDLIQSLVKGIACKRLWRKLWLVGFCEGPNASLARVNWGCFSLFFLSNTIQTPKKVQTGGFKPVLRAFSPCCFVGLLHIAHG